MKLIDTLKKIFYIVRNYDNDISFVKKEIKSLENILKERTEIAADVNFNGDSYVVVIGKYKNSDYVQTYSVYSKGDLSEIVDHLKHLQKYGSVRFIDCPPNVRGRFNKTM